MVEVNIILRLHTDRLEKLTAQKQYIGRISIHMRWVASYM